MPSITITLPSGEDITHELSGASITVGRRDENAIVLDEGSISGAHAEFIQSGDGYLLRDLESTNGTFVNGEPASDTQLKNSDAVAFGSVLASYASEEAAEEEPVPDEGESLIHEPEEITAPLAESSARPSEFTSISPFPKKRKKKDPFANAVLALGILSLVASAGVAIFATIMKAG